MLGPDIGKLNFYVKAGNRRGLIWSFGENLGDIWNEAEVTIKKISDFSNFTIVIEGYFFNYNKKKFLTNRNFFIR